MVAYEFYLADDNGGENLIGILPERRKNPARIDENSIINWGKIVIGAGESHERLYFKKIVLDQDM